MKVVEAFDALTRAGVAAQLRRRRAMAVLEAFRAVIERLVAHFASAVRRLHGDIAGRPFIAVGAGPGNAAHTEAACTHGSTNAGKFACVPRLITSFTAVTEKSVAARPVGEDTLPGRPRREADVVGAKLSVVALRVVRALGKHRGGPAESQQHSKGRNPTARTDPSGDKPSLI